jgi:hypothetical protein
MVLVMSMLDKPPTSAALLVSGLTDLLYLLWCMNLGQGSCIDSFPAQSGLSGLHAQVESYLKLSCLA